MAEKACHGFGSTTQVGLTQALGRMAKYPVLVGKLIGSAWLLYAAFVTATLALISVPHGPYVPGLVFGATALLCLAGTAMFWRARSLHWATIAALLVSGSLAIYGKLFQ